MATAYAEAQKLRADMNTTSGPSDCATTLGNQMIAVHDWLRVELAQLREDIELFVDGVSGAHARDVQVHCAAYCAALARHHRGQENGAFPELSERFPELDPVLNELRHDHHMMSELMRRLQELAGRLEGDALPDPVLAQRVLGEADGLVALLDSHVEYEAKTIRSSVDSLGAPDWNGSEADFLLTDVFGEGGGESGETPTTRPSAGSTGLHA